MADDKEVLVPEIRFKGFTDDWVRRKLSECGEFKNGMNFNKDAMGHGYPFVNLQDIFGKTIIDDNGLGLTESTIKQREEYSLKKGDILFVRSSVKPEGVGETALVANDFPDTTYSGFIIRFRTFLEMDDQYKRYVFTTKSIRNQIMTKATSSANTNINQDSLGLTQIHLPCIEEQTIIGNFFCTLDDTITRYKRKLNRLKELKSGYLQTMFPQEGERVPRLRFIGFSEPWEQRKLGDIGSVEMCRRIFKEETSSSGDVPFYKIGTFGGEPDAYITKKQFEEYKEKYSYPEVGDVLLSASGTIGRTVIYTGKESYFQDSNIVWLRIDKERVINIFLQQFYQIAEWNGIEGTTIKRLYNSNIHNTKIFVPSIPEQTAIGNFFRNLDEQITAQQTKLDKLTQLKAAYLQKMFI